MVRIFDIVEAPDQVEEARASGRVDHGGGFVEDQDGGGATEDPGEGQQLFFAGGQFVAPLADQGVEAERQAADKRAIGTVDVIGIAAAGETAAGVYPVAAVRTLDAVIRDAEAVGVDSVRAPVSVRAASEHGLALCEAARREFYAKMDAANVDLKAFTADFYQKVCKARLEPVLENIRLCHELGILDAAMMHSVAASPNCKSNNSNSWRNCVRPI